ncbi:hypothetical protein OUZ56_011988 [Daphnia magna]|uniref:Uncharacterized protein n=1 Tax=Daphnia magna TaxID=35525 RepID=A0ABQ9Z211_9CRUS|nr:hypothetical protein OUZ56_011988 [Daphnia magna]
MASPSTSAAYDSDIAKNISPERTDSENESQNSNEDVDFEAEVNGEIRDPDEKKCSKHAARTETMKKKYVLNLNYPNPRVANSGQYTAADDVLNLHYPSQY